MPQKMAKILSKTNSDLEMISNDEKGENSKFLAKLWQMVEQNSSLAKWGETGKTILIDKTKTDYLVKNFKMKKMSSFVKGLNIYGFQRVTITFLHFFIFVFLL